MVFGALSKSKTTFTADERRLTPMNSLQQNTPATEK
jgi:hypothetical protein